MEFCGYGLSFEDDSHNDDEVADYWWAKRRQRSKYLDDEKESGKTRKARKLETRPRAGQFDGLYAKGDARRRVLDPTTSPWWALLQNPETRDETSARGKRFRRKFRLPLTVIERIVQSCSAANRLD